MHVINMSAWTFFGTRVHTCPVLACRTRVEKRQELFIFPSVSAPCACPRACAPLQLVHYIFRAPSPAVHAYQFANN